MRSVVAGKARVHELAKELGVSSKVVLTKLNELGEFVKSASSTVEAPVARRLREVLTTQQAESKAAKVPPKAARPAAKKAAAKKAVPTPGPTPGPSPAKVAASATPASAHDIEVAAAEARAARLKQEQELAVKAAQEHRQQRPEGGAAVTTPGQPTPSPTAVPRPGPRPAPRPAARPAAVAVAAVAVATAAAPVVAAVAVVTAAVPAVAAAHPVAVRRASVAAVAVPV